jgi:TPR repeat protein
VRQRVILLGLLVAFVLAGLWFLLDRGAGGTKDVDAAEAPPAASQNPGQLNSPEARAPGGQSSDFAESLLDLRRRAGAGDAEAEFELGAKYASGEDVRQDYTEAVKWFARAAEGGQVLAAATLGAYYWAGRGVPQDDVSAFMWSSIAKDGGDEASKYRLAILRARMTATEVAEGEQRAGAWRQSHSRPALMRRTTE